MSPVIAVTSLDDVIDVLGGAPANDDDDVLILQRSLNRLRSRLTATAELLDELVLREPTVVWDDAYQELRDTLLFDSH